MKRRLQKDAVIYAASAGEWSKVGVTRSLLYRRYAIRRYAGMRFEIMQTWKHADPFAIESMVKQSLRSASRDAVTSEAFHVPLITMKREINWAIAAYKRYKFNHKSKPEEFRMIARFLQRTRAYKCRENAKRRGPRASRVELANAV